MFKSILQSATVLGVAAMMASVGPVAASSQGIIEDTGASERINYAGMLRSLSQIVPGSACFAHAKVETDAAMKRMSSATAKFDQIVNALQNGDESIGIIGEETDRKILAGLKKLKSEWEPLHTDVEHIEANGGTDEDVGHLADKSGDVLAVAVKLVPVIASEYSDPTALLQADAITINFAGRQRMLAQRISKNVCLIASGINAETAMEELKSARATYETSANALRFGMPDAGINGSDNPEINAGLDQVLADWASVQPILDAAVNGQEVSKEDLATMFHKMNSLTAQMNTLVGMYTEDSKLGL